MFITPQGLSKSIKNLEDELQTPLFERTYKGLIPTESGIYLYNHSQRLIQQMENIKIGIQRIRDREIYFEIGFSCGVLNLFDFDKIDSLKRMYPNVNIIWNEAENNEIIERIQRNQIDVGFVIGEVPFSELYVRKIYEKQFDVLVYEGHPLYDKEKISIKDLKNQPLITLNEKYFSYHSLIQRCHDFDFIPNIIFKTMESQLIYRFCKDKAGLGIDVNIHQNDIIEAGLKRIELYDAIPWKISLVVQKERIYEDMIQALISIII